VSAFNMEASFNSTTNISPLKSYYEAAWQQPEEPR